MENERNWYVVNTYSGHEHKVKENLEKKVSAMGLENDIFNILIPETTVTEVKHDRQGNETRVNKTKPLWPGYVLVEMNMTDELWYIVRNTNGVTGFIGSSGGGAKPFPVDEEQVTRILKYMGMNQGVGELKINFDVNDEVKILSGPFSGKEGKVVSIDMEKEKAIVEVEFLGNLSSAEVSLLSLEKTED